MCLTVTTGACIVELGGRGDGLDEKKKKGQEKCFFLVIWWRIEI